MEKNPKFTYNKIIILGIIIGILSFFSFGLFLALSGIILAGLVVWRVSEEEDRIFLINLFISAILLRIIISSAFYIFSIASGGAGEMIPDSRTYSLKAVSLVRSYLYPQRLFPPVVEAGVGYNGYLLMLIPFYLICGYDFATPANYYFFPDKLINCLIGVLSGIVIFYLTKELFGRKAARISSILVVFYPTLVLWSMTNLREPMQVFLTSLALLGIVRFQKSQRIAYLFWALIAALAVATIRNYAFFLILSAGAVAYFINLKAPLIKKISIAVLSLIVINILLNLTGPGRTFKKNYFNERVIAERILLANAGITSQPGSTYRIYEGGLVSNGKVDKLGFARGALKGWLFFIFSPFPWDTNTKLQLLTYPQMIVWYFLIPFIILGILISLRYKFRFTFALFLFLFLFAFGHALVEGNIGSTFRHRDLISPFYFIFAAVGLLRFFQGRFAVEEDQ